MSLSYSVKTAVDNVVHQFILKVAEKYDLDANELLKLGIVDAVLPEPTGGAHRNWDQMATVIKSSLNSEIAALEKEGDLCSGRYKKYRVMGEFLTT